MTESHSTTLGLIAEFDDADALIAGALSLKAAGYHRFECHSPFPLHGIDEALGEKPSRVSYVAALGAIIGFITAALLQGWTSTYAYPLIISGKPFFSYQAYVPITFALSVLFAAFAALGAFILFSKLKYHHPLFNSDAFARFSDDGFFISIDSEDKLFDPAKTAADLAAAGGRSIEILAGP